MPSYIVQHVPGASWSLSGPINAYQGLSKGLSIHRNQLIKHGPGAMNQHLRKCASSLPNVIRTYSNKSPCKMCSQASQAFKNKGGTRPPNTSTILDHPSTQHRPYAESTSLQIPRPQSSSQQHLTSSDIQ